MAGRGDHESDDLIRCILANVLVVVQSQGFSKVRLNAQKSDGTINNQSSSIGIILTGMMLLSASLSFISTFPR